MKVGGESMNEIRFWTTEKGDLSHLSYIFAIRSHCVQSSRKSTVLLQGTRYLLK